MKYEKYSAKKQAQKLAYYRNLPEKQRRHFLALEYLTLGEGSQRYVASIFGCCRKTIVKGVKELRLAGDTPIDYLRQRNQGGGAKKKKSPFLI